MLLKALGTFSLLALSAFAAPAPNTATHQLERRDYATIKGVLNEVIKNLNALTDKAKKWNGDVIEAVPILDSSGVVLKSLQDGVAKCADTTAIGLIDVIQILFPVMSLNSAVDGVVKTLIDKKPLFDKAFLTIVVSDQLLMQKVAAVNLVDAVIAKLPAYIPGALGKMIINPVLTKLDKVVDAYKPAQ